MIRLINGNCIEVMQEGIEKESIDLIVTSPPYNVGIDYDVWSDFLDWNEYEEFITDFFYSVRRVLKDVGRFAVNVLLSVNRSGKAVNLLHLYIKAMEAAGLLYKNVVTFKEPEKNKSKLTAWGSWLSASAPFIQNNTEIAIIGYKKYWKKQKKGKSTMSKEEFIKWVAGDWPYLSETRKEYKAAFSLYFPDAAIKLLSYEGDTVLDPFMGSGTTGIAAKVLNRDFIGIEISRNYVEIARSRIKNAEEEYKRYLESRKRVFGF